MSDLSPLAFSPGSISLFFLPCPASSPSEVRSRGCAVNLKVGVSAGVDSASNNVVLYNGEEIGIAPVQRVLRRLAPEPVCVSLTSELPIGCGFGVSAASSLALAFALRSRFDLALADRDLILAAHTAEVESGTGIGDVAAQVCGGFVLRRCVEGPFDCLKLDIDCPSLAFRVFGPLSTAEVLGSTEVMDRVRSEGRRSMGWLEQRLDTVSAAELLDESLRFSQAVGLIQSSPVAESIRQVKAHGGHAAMVLLGQAVVSVDLPAGSSGWVRHEVDTRGTRLL